MYFFFIKKRRRYFWFWYIIDSIHTEERDQSCCPKAVQETALSLHLFPPLFESLVFKMRINQQDGVSQVDEPSTSVHDNTTLDQGDATVNGILSDSNAIYESNEATKMPDVAKETLNIPCIYRQDVVRSNEVGMIGIVSEVAGDSDSDSSITDDEEEEDDDNDEDETGGNEEGDNHGNTNASSDGNRSGGNYKSSPLPDDQVRVLWMDDSETTENLNDVTVIDRGFMHGDYVASASDPTGQVGVVVDVNISIDLLPIDGTIIEQVSSRDLKRVRDFAVGDYVVLGPWLGRIDDVLDNVTVSFDDGSVCKVMKADPLRLKPVTKNILEDGHFPYYPGQRVRARSSSVFKNSRWLSGLWKANRLEGTVTKVTVGSVFIYWIASAGYGPDSSTTPAEEQNPKNLKLLSCFAHANWQVGDWCLLPSLALSSSITQDKGQSELEPHDSTRKKEDNYEKALLIVNTRTRVDVSWQDGTTARGLPSTTLIPIDSPGDHEFVSEQYVVEKASDESDDASEVRRVGVVKSVNAKERTACVRWLKPVVRAEDPREFDREEVVSVYELEGHLDYDYCYGDVVVRLSPVKQDLNNNSGCKKVEDESADGACMDFSDLSWVGNITGLKNGDIEVTWADGMVSTVGPQAVYVVGRDDDDESIAGGSEVSDDAASWETVNDDEMDALENAKEEIGLPNTADTDPETEEHTTVEDNNPGRNGALSLPLAALGFVTRLATGIFSRGRKHVEPPSSDSEGENELQSQGAIKPSQIKVSHDETNSPNNVIDNFGLQTTHEKEEEHVGVEVTDSLDMAEALVNLRANDPDALACHEYESCSFKRFDIAKDPLDHYFIGASGQNSNGRKWLKKVQQDWSILQNNLPDGIYVRVYEDRMDLLRAVIAGAYGTPYQDGLFFFDFHLPPEYPDVPPSAYYHSGGWRINPNLYEEGKVCLSLLNTWTGRGNEVWDPVSSSILQVLVSLQGLVLNSKPYFNEAGYDKQIGTAEGEKNSLSYNENTFLLNCKTMMYLMRKPPKDFEELVKDHFKRQGYYILKACDAYMKGYLIGSLSKDASTSDRSNTNSTSVGFKLMLTKIAPRLFLALNEVGADCQEFKHLQQS
ncbi:unnamed protein product, partial [Vitis vinifera]